MLEFLSPVEIAVAMAGHFTPVWIAIAIVMGASLMARRRLGLYGRLFETTMGMVGLFIVLFWIFTAFFADTVAPFNPIQPIAIMKQSLPGAVEPQSGEAYLLGGDKLARDVFSRMVHGSRIVLTIAPAATLLAFVIGIFLGLPAGYWGGRLDAVLSFLANLILAFPVILLFYLLVTPGVRDAVPVDLGLFQVQWSIPIGAAVIFTSITAAFFAILIYSRYSNRANVLTPALGVLLIMLLWAMAGLGFGGLDGYSDPLGVFPVDASMLNIFVAVVFASSPGVFRIVRGLTLDISTRDYVAAAQTRGEGPWYIMLWEILPNARGPLIVDACLRVGYTTILLGTLGFFGLGLQPESPDWGTNIKEGSKLWRQFVHPALPPALALMSFVLGLNLLADALREQSLKD